MERSNFFLRVLFGGLPLAAVVTLSIGFAYVAAQQAYRMNANDPQIGLAEDAANALAHGAEVTAVIPATQVEIDTSPSAYVIVYDSAGKPIAGNGALHGGAPVLPEGVLAAAHASGENRITWEPQDGVRQAIVVVPYSHSDTSGFTNGYVMSGRSLSNTEKNIGNLTYMAEIALVASLLVTLILIALKELIAQ